MDTPTFATLLANRLERRANELCSDGRNQDAAALDETVQAIRGVLDDMRHDEIAAKLRRGEHVPHR